MDPEPLTLIGVMSGTSLDGCDAAVVTVAQNPPRVEIHGAVHHPFPDDWRTDLWTLASGIDVPVSMVSRYHTLLAEAYARAVEEILSRFPSPRPIAGIACHGQTIHHNPKLGHTLQIGSGTVLATLTGLPAIYDFRAADLAVGGEGAPLSPLGHYYLFGDSSENRLIVNLGGIINFTFLPAGSQEKEIKGYDCAPGNILYDNLVAALFPGHKTDHDGNFSKGGKSHPEAAEIVFSHPFVARRPPKSTGREEFPGDLVGKFLAFGQHHQLSPADILVSAAEAVATVVASTVRQEGWQISSVILAGGGAFNPTWVNALKQQFATQKVISSTTLGFDPAAVEAACWAVLGYRRLKKLPGNLPAVTGARRQVLLGAVALP